ncbi:MAG TPA: hypothetical protein DDY82_00810 [Clostridiales bacterium]|nr:hypothetical protein [Clostridiales bacterium]
MKFGLILTLTSVLVVFFALTVLYFCYSGIGKALNTDWKGWFRRRGEGSDCDGKMPPEVAAAVAMALERELVPEDEVAAAISMALEAEGYGEVHDVESYVITIRR